MVSVQITCDIRCAAEKFRKINGDSMALLRAG
jgi:hypothetical protein